MLKYEIEGGNLPVVICYPEQGQTICTQKGSMSWMSPNMQMDTKAGSFKKAIGRLFSGESIFLNEFTPTYGSGAIAFASCFPGTIMPFTLNGNESIVVQKTGFLAMESTLELSVFFQHKLGVGFFGGEGFIMQKISGNGVAFIEIDGYCKEYTLGVGESIIVDTGHLAAMSDTCSLEIQAVKGFKNVLFGGSGIFHTKVMGPGKVYLQSMPICNIARVLEPHITKTSSDSSDEGGIKINIGK